MLSEFQTINLFPTSLFEILTNIFIALLCGMFIALIYKKSYKGAGYSAGFANSVIMLTLITAIVIMVIGNNLARAFGLVGAMSIIRFRTAVKDTQDIVFIFFGLSVGMAAGVGYHKLALFGTVIIGVLVLILSKTNFTSTKPNDYLLQFAYRPNGTTTPPYQNVLNKYCRRHNIINTKTVDELGLIELSYYVKLKNKEKNQEFIRELDNLKEVNNISIFFDEDEI